MPPGNLRPCDLPQSGDGHTRVPHAGYASSATTTGRCVVAIAAAFPAEQLAMHFRKKI
jgi:hypothetical protein